MQSKNGFMTCRRKHFTFINNVVLFILFAVLTIILSGIFCVVIFLWDEIVWPMKIIGITMEPIVLLAMIFMPFNGMYVRKGSTIVFVPDFRIKRFRIGDLERLSIIFTEWENGKYAATVKFVYKNGKSFEKNYSKQFRNLRKKAAPMSLYTIEKSKVSRYFEELKELEKCNITIIDRMGNIVKQVINSNS